MSRSRGLDGRTQSSLTARRVASRVCHRGRGMLLSMTPLHCGEMRLVSGYKREFRFDYRHSHVASTWTGACAGVGGSVGDDVPGGVAAAGRRHVAHVLHVFRPVDDLSAAARRHGARLRRRRPSTVAATCPGQCRHGARPASAPLQETRTYSSNLYSPTKW